MSDADMKERHASMEPLQTAAARARRRLGLPGELAALPALTVLLGLAFLEIFSRQRLLFASLASSAFIIYSRPAARRQQHSHAGRRTPDRGERWAADVPRAWTWLPRRRERMVKLQSQVGNCLGRAGVLG